MTDVAGARPAFGGVHHTAVTVTDTGVVDSEVPFGYSVVGFRDPDNTQLELGCLRT
jgi:hypothetical protein